MPSFESLAELAWAEFYVGRVGMGRVVMHPKRQLDLYSMYTDPIRGTYRSGISSFTFTFKNVYSQVPI